MRVNITGYSPQQNHTKRSNRRGLAGLAELLPDILRENGHEVDYNLENADLNIVFLLSLASINTYGKYVNSCVELLRLPNTIIAFDDWNIKSVYDSHEKAAAGYDFPTHHNHKGQNISKNADVFKRIVDGDYPVIYPAYKTGDHSLLGIRGDKQKFCLDYSNFISKTPSEGIKRENIYPVHASLSDKTSWLKKLGYPVLDLKKVNEQRVFDEYYQHRVVVIPPHYHDKSGWFRNRYTMANLAGAIVVEDQSQVFGSSYAISGGLVFKKGFTEKTLEDVFEIQNKAYHRTVMSKDEVSEVVKQIEDFIRKIS